MAFRTAPGASLPPSSLRRRLVKRMGLSAWMRRTRQRMAGFQYTASSTPRAAEGV